MISHVIAKREPDAEARTGFLGRLGRDSAPVLLDDAVGDRETEPGADADRLGGKERVEDPLDVCRRDAAAVVGEHELYAVIAFSSAHLDASAFAYRLRRVYEQIQEHLLESLRLAGNGRQTLE